MKFWETFLYNLPPDEKYQVVLENMSNHLELFKNTIGNTLIRNNYNGIEYYLDTENYSIPKLGIDSNDESALFFKSLGETWINGEIVISKKSIDIVYNKLIESKYRFKYQNIITNEDLFRFLLHHERGHQLHLYSNTNIPLDAKEIINRDANLYLKSELKEQIADSYSIYSLKLSKEKYILLRNSLVDFVKLILPIDHVVLPNIYSFNKEELYNNYNKCLNYIKL